MDTQSFEAELKNEGYETATNSNPANKINPEHTHPYDVKALVLKGEITLNCDGTATTYKEGQIFAMARDTPHFEAYGPEGTTILFGRRQ